MGQGIFHNILIKYIISGEAIPVISSEARNLILTYKRFLLTSFVEMTVSEKLPNPSTIHFSRLGIRRLLSHDLIIIRQLVIHIFSGVFVPDIAGVELCNQILNILQCLFKRHS